MEYSRTFRSLRSDFADNEASSYLLRSFNFEEIDKDEVRTVRIRHFGPLPCVYVAAVASVREPLGPFQVSISETTMLIMVRALYVKIQVKMTTLPNLA